MPALIPANDKTYRNGTLAEFQFHLERQIEHAITALTSVDRSCMTPDDSAKIGEAIVYLRSCLREAQSISAFSD